MDNEIEDAMPAQVALILDLKRSAGQFTIPALCAKQFACGATSARNAF